MLSVKGRWRNGSALHSHCRGWEFKSPPVHMIKNIIFDLGGVILTHKKTLTEDILTDIFPSIKDKAFLFYTEKKRLIRTGKITSDEFLASLIKELGSSIDLPTLKKAWIDEYKRVAHIDNKILKLVDTLSKKFHVYLFTDTIDIHDEYNSKRDIYSHFKRVFKSYEEGLIKPDVKAFENVLQKIKAKPDECIFIDDLEENVMAAQSIGMIGIIYTDIKQLRNSLFTVGVST